MPRRTHPGLAHAGRRTEQLQFGRGSMPRRTDWRRVPKTVVEQMLQFGRGSMPRRTYFFVVGGNGSGALASIRPRLNAAEDRKKGLNITGYSVLQFGRGSMPRRTAFGHTEGLGLGQASIRPRLNA